MVDVTQRYSFRGLLATLSPEVYFGCEPNGWVLRCYVHVPHRDDPHRRFATYVLRHWDDEPSQDEVDVAVLTLFGEVLEHEARECLGVLGAFTDPHEGATP